MECDIVFNIGGKDLEEFTIKKEDSLKLLSSLNDIVEYIFDNWNKEDESKGQRLLDYLRNTTRTIIDNNNFFKNRAIVGNSSVMSLRNTYPSIDSILQHIPEDEIYKKDYIVTLINQTYISGTAFKGRTSAFGVITHVIRNLYDAEKFAKTILLTYLAEKKIKDGEIDDEYLRNKYQSKLKSLLTESRIKSIKEHLNNEIKNFDSKNYKVTILDLILDYLNYKSSYENTQIKQKESYLNAQAILQDFCRELQGFNIINEDSETDLAKKLRILDYKRETFGKKELHDAIKMYGTQEQKNLLATKSEQDFISMNIKDMNEFIKQLFKDDIILSRYSVKSVDVTKESNEDLTQEQIKTLIKNKKNKQDKRKTNEILKSFTSIDEVQSFFGENLVITLDGVDYNIKLVEINGEIKFLYFGKKITNNDKIILQRDRTLLINEYDSDEKHPIIGYDTKAIFVPVNRDGIVDGLYKGYYIYQHDKSNKSSEYIISRSVFHPNLFNPVKVSSLKDAKLTIDNFIRTTKIKKATNIELKKHLGSEAKNIDPDTRSVVLDSPVFNGQTISSIQYIIGKDVVLPPQEYFLYEHKTLEEVRQYYLLEFNIDISKLDTPEKIGIFLYALVENNITIGDVLQKSQVYSEYEEKDFVTGKSRTRLKLESTNIDEEVLNKINNIIDDINKTPVQNFLVERWNKNEENKEKSVTNVYLRSLQDITINSIGLTPEGNLPEYSLVTALESLKKYLNNTLFNKQEIVNIISKEELRTSDEFKGLFSNDDIINATKAFVHNNNIYLIRGNSSIYDMIHEVFHIMFASIKANNIRLYEKIITELYNKAPEGYKTFVEDNYSNFAQIDKMEEVVVRSLARQVENNTTFFYNNYNESDTTILKEIALTFRQLSSDIKKKLNVLMGMRIKDSLDFEVPGKILGLSSSDDKIRMRQITNLIRKGIANNEIIEDCK